MRRDHISLQLYPVREETARDMPATLRKISEIGYPAVEFAGYGGLTPQDLKPIHRRPRPPNLRRPRPPRLLGEESREDPRRHTHPKLFPRRPALGPARASWGRVL